mmetsp:Transcript_122271/g.391170  ORF Transcript_122271/g.391170 Transcript_122271/m.391170 type:complete len:221 (+) Transcript_122271:1786-2448(+)
MCDDTIVRDPIHLHRLDVDLHWGAIHDHGCVQRQVQVLLWRRDVVPQLVGHGRQEGMDLAQDFPACVPVRSDHLHPRNRQRRRRVGPRGPTPQLRVHRLLRQLDVADGAVVPVVDQQGSEILLQVPQIALSGDDGLLVHLGQDLVGVAVEVPAAELLELRLPDVDAEALGERHEDGPRLLGDSPLLVRRHEVQGPHVVHPVRELDDEDTDIVCGSVQDLP